MTKGKRLQYGFHDGKTVISDKNFAVGDTCIIQLPDAQITDSIKFEKNCLALIISGENAGKIGKVDDLREGLFSLPTRALVSIEDRSVELPVEMVMAIGSDKPVIKVS
jgi:small subunit ribosomal protein S4e